MKDSRSDALSIKKDAARIRADILEMIQVVQSGHPGGSLSIVEILLALYRAKLRVDPGDPHREDRDRFILSKGHCAPALYAVLADAGFFPRERLLDSFRRINGMLQGHPDMNKTPGVDMTTGSLGTGLSVGCGMALAARIRNLHYNVYVLLGDGELNEGQVWEAAKTAVHLRLDSLVAMVDVNRYQNDGPTDTEMTMEPLDDKWRAFGWNTLRANGHDAAQVLEAFDQVPMKNRCPTVILFDTIKGKGVSFMEQDKVRYHGTAPDSKQLEQALHELLQ